MPASLLGAGIPDSARRIRSLPSRHSQSSYRDKYIVVEYIVVNSDNFKEEIEEVW